MSQSAKCNHVDSVPIAMVGFDADDTLWRSQDYFDSAQQQFEQILAKYVDLDDVGARLYATEAANIALFGYGVKGMLLSMIEAALQITEGRISGDDISRILRIGKALLQHPVELLDGIEQAVAEISAQYPLVLITKGDLFHQEAKVRASGLAQYFPRIEIVSEKDSATYQRLLQEFGISAAQFVMIGNSLRSDIAPVLALGGWAIHMPYHSTWAHEREASLGADISRLLTVQHPAKLADALAHINQMQGQKGG